MVYLKALQTRVGIADCGLMGRGCVGVAGAVEECHLLPGWRGVDGGDGGAVGIEQVSIKGHGGWCPPMWCPLMEKDVGEFRGFEYCFHGVDVSLYFWPSLIRWGAATPSMTGLRPFRLFQRCPVADMVRGVFDFLHKHLSVCTNIIPN